MITFLCVLKVNNSNKKICTFNKNHVLTLKKDIEKYYTKKHDFYCLTDIGKIDGVNTIPLTNDYDKFWSKIELFKHDFEKIVYLDLDCIILKNINWLDDIDVSDGSMWSTVQKDIYGNKLNSSMMLWKGKKEIIYKNFNYTEIIKNKYYVYGGICHKTGEKISTVNLTIADQGYIHDILIDNNISLNFFDKNKINFYKSTCVEDRKNLDILFFTGFPKIEDCVYDENFKTYIIDISVLTKNVLKEFSHVILKTEYYNEELINSSVIETYSDHIDIKNKNESLLKFKISYYTGILHNKTLDFCHIGVHKKLNEYKKRLNLLQS